MEIFKKQNLGHCLIQETECEQTNKKIQAEAKVGEKCHGNKAKVI